MSTTLRQEVSRYALCDPKHVTTLREISNAAIIKPWPGNSGRALIGCLLIALSSACSTLSEKTAITEDIDPADLITVDCLLPPQVRQLGTQISYLAPRRAIRTSGARCALRGGEYVAYDRADFKAALSVWLPQAELDDPEAQTYVGEIFEKGLGTPASYEQAATWYQRAADQNYPRAQINLGYLYESGLGVKRDLTRALNLYREASGFTAAKLEYVSSIEVAKRETSRQHSEQLQEEVHRLERRINEHSRLLESQEQELSDKAKRIETLKLSLAKRTADTSKNADGLAELNAHYQKEKESLQAELETQKADYRRQTETLESLQIKLTGKQAEVSEPAFENISQTQHTGPSINIIDPPVLITRGSSGMRFSGSTPVNIIGQVDPANELYAFRINGREQTVDESGLFTFEYDNADIPSLELLAVDRKGASTRLAIDLPLKTSSEIQASSVQASDFQASDFQASDAFSEKAADRQPLPPSTRKLSEPLPVSDIPFGKYHALVIGNNNYDAMTDLQTAGNDAIAVEQILREKYGFQTVLLLNANQKTLLNALERMRVALGPQDNLVIYYAGHGELDEQSGRGYWLPADASATDRSRWIANSVITSMIDTMQAKHVLVIADSCYSGTLTRSSVARPLPEASTALKRKWLKAVTQARVRTVLSSGGVKPVLDGLPGSTHSVFAAHFLNALSKNNTVLETYDLFFDLQQQVASTAATLHTQQIPQYAPLRHAGHQAGEFIFVPQNLTRL